MPIKAIDVKIIDREITVDAVPIISVVVNFVNIYQKKYPKKNAITTSKNKYAAPLPTAIFLKSFHLFLYQKKS